MTGPTQPAAEQLVLAEYIEGWLRAETDQDAAGWIADTARRLAASLSEDVVEPELARLRDEVTEAHARNLALRDEHRRDLIALTRLLLAANDAWSPHAADLDSQVKAAETAIRGARDTATSMAGESWALMRRERDEARAEQASMVRDLHAAQFDGATALPDRPLDTVWEWLLDLVRKDRALLSGGNTPADTAEQVNRVAKYLLGLQQAGGASPEEIDQFWAEELKPFSRDLWRGRARALLDLLAGSAVTTPEALAVERLADDPALAVLRAKLDPVKPCGATEGGMGVDCHLIPGHDGWHNASHNPRTDGSESIGYPFHIQWPRTEWDRCAPPAGAAVPAPADTEVLRTPDEWAHAAGMVIHDPDGWRGRRGLPKRPYEDPISYLEFVQRAMWSTVEGPVGMFDAPPTQAVGADPEGAVGREAREDAEDWKHHDTFIPVRDIVPPPPPAVVECKAHEGGMGVRCHLAAGHDGWHNAHHTMRTDGTESIGYPFDIQWPRNEYDRCAPVADTAHERTEPDA